MSEHKILTLEQADAWFARHRARGARLGFTCGSFDLLHAGHVHYLSEARNLCDALIVAANSDLSIQRYKSPLRPIQPINERLFVLAALECVDAVTTLDDLRPRQLIERWQPDLYIKGGDYRTKRLRSSDAVSAYGGETVVIPLRYSTSTSHLLERIRTLDAQALPESALPRSHCIVFLDRDGTLIENTNFLHDPSHLRLKEGVTAALARLRAAGYRLVIVTNQQGIGLGYYGMDEFIAVNQRLLKEIGSAGATIDRIYFCPHSAADQCSCRKPLPGMLLRACRDFSIEPTDCFFIGDSVEDQKAGLAAGIRTFLVGDPDPTFSDAARWVLSHPNEGRVRAPE